MDEEEVERRSRSSSKAGKARHRSQAEVLEGELVSDDGVPLPEAPGEDALAPVSALPHRRQSALLALVQFGDVASAARHAEVEESAIEGWLESDETFKRAFDLLSPHSPRMQAEKLRLGASRAADRLRAVVENSSDVDHVIAASRLLLKYSAEAQDVAMTGMIDKLVRRIERLEGGKKR